MDPGQSSFDFDARARRSDPDTSKAAAAATRGQRANQLEQLVLDTIRRLGGATIKEVATATGLAEVSVSPRFKPLRRKNLIRDSGAKRENIGGRSAIVWEAL
jgi:hypothetical protein